MLMRRSQAVVTALTRGEPCTSSKLLSSSIQGWLDLKSLGERCVSDCFNKVVGRASSVPSLSAMEANSPAATKAHLRRPRLDWSQPKRLHHTAAAPGTQGERATAAAEAGMRFGLVAMGALRTKCAVGPVLSGAPRMLLCR